MRLALLQERRYAPYGKWLGTAFAQLDRLDGLDVHLSGVLAARDLEGREAFLTAAYERLARGHNELSGDALDPRVRAFHGRPALVLGADRFVEACLRRVDDPRLRAYPLIGSVDQFCDSTDALDDAVTTRRFASVYGARPSLGADLG